MSSLAELQQAAVKLFAARGFAATGIRDIGREVGLTSGVLYHYAGSKDDLLLGVMTVCLQNLLDGARAACDAAPDPAARLAGIVRAHIGLSAANPRTAQVTDSEVRALSAQHRAAVMELRDAYDGLVQATMEDGARTGAFDLTDAGVTRLALLEMCNGVSRWYDPAGRLTIPTLADRFADLAFRLVGARVAVPSTVWTPPTHLPCEPS